MHEIYMPLVITNYYFLFKMAYELHGMLTGAVSLTTWEKVMPAYGGQSESFLNNVVTPIYEVIRKVLYEFNLCFQLSQFL